MVKNLRTTFIAWIPLGFAVIALAGLVYLAVQQDLRQSANDPQIQMAEDEAAALAANVEFVPGNKVVDIGQSLAPYLVIFDDAGNPMVGTGLLHGALPQLPKGVFDHTKAFGEDRLTWQPEPGVRSAIVVVRTNGTHPGFVMAGRSLREVEVREDQLSFEVGAALVVTLIGTLLLKVLVNFFG